MGNRWQDLGGLPNPSLLERKGQWVPARSTAEPGKLPWKTEGADRELAPGVCVTLAACLNQEGILLPAPVGGERMPP